MPSNDQTNQLAAADGGKRPAGTGFIEIVPEAPYNLKRMIGLWFSSL
jgi:hypothetical protein